MNLVPRGLHPWGLDVQSVILIEWVVEVLRDADVGEAVHGEGVLAVGRRQHGRERPRISGTRGAMGVEFAPMPK